MWSIGSDLFYLLCSQLVKILIALEPYGIFELNFAYLFILILSSHPCMRNGDKGLLSIILAGQGLSVKMLITLERHILIKFCVLIHVNIIETHVCKTAIRFCQDFLQQSL